MKTRTLQNTILGATALALAALAATPIPARELSRGRADFGLRMELTLHRQSMALFGVEEPLRHEANDSDFVPREAATADQRVKLAGGLEARFVARNVAVAGDMIAFWPSAGSYTHLILCIEQDRSGLTPAGNAGLNASVQRVEVASGKVETILHGMDNCDGIRTTPWGTILATEESGPDGRAYEILDPLGTTDHWIADRPSGDVRDALDSPTASRTIVQRPRLGSFSWEGIEVFEDGVVVAGDELRPGGGEEGGAIFKFIPAVLRNPAEGPIHDLAESPLAAGTLYALQIGTTDFGQGNQRGVGKWIGPVDTDDLLNLTDLTSSEWARRHNATGFYRPEDLHRDPAFAGPGALIYWNNTGRDAGSNFAETLTLHDPEPSNPASRPVVQTFVEGDERFQAFDNLDLQPHTGRVYIIEDDSFGEVWACLPDGADRNLTSDGCVSILSVVDPEAEPTGFIFDASGRVAYLVIQHGQQHPSLLDFSSNPVDGATDDLLMITGFETDLAPYNR
jgi:hypothetical protein